MEGDVITDVIGARTYTGIVVPELPEPVAKLVAGICDD